MSDLFDQDKLDALSEAIIDALRPVGITVVPEALQVAHNQGQEMVMIMGIIRDGAASQKQESLEMKADLNKMLAEQHRQQVAEQIENIKKLASEEALEEALFGENACEHPNIHPEGFCIDCGETDL